MKLSKLILLVTLGLLIVTIISTGLAFGAELLFGWAFIKTFIFITVLQFVGKGLWDKFWVDAQIINHYKEYANKPYKSYGLNLRCNQCGHENFVETDFDNPEFICSHCKKKNAIQIEFRTVTITDPLYENDINRIMSSLNKIP